MPRLRSASDDDSEVRPPRISLFFVTSDSRRFFTACLEPVDLTRSPLIAAVHALFNLPTAQELPSRLVQFTAF